MSTELLIKHEPAIIIAGRIVQAGASPTGEEIHIFPAAEPSKQPPPPLPREIAEVTAAMAQHDATATAAARIAQGLPPVPPGPPPPKYPLVTDHVLDGVAQAIQNLPEAERRQAVMEAHDHLTAALKEHGKFVLNGRLELLESPARAAEIAAQIINQKIAEMGKAQESAVEEARSQPIDFQPEPEAMPITRPVLATRAARPAAARPAEIPTEDRDVLSTDDVRAVRARLERAGYDTWPPVRVGKRMFFPTRARAG